MENTPKIYPLPTLDELVWLSKQCGDSKVYAIPKNGLIIALMARLNLVNDIAEADIIFDDLSDSGKTLEPYIEIGRAHV